MCGRFTLTASAGALARVFNLEPDDVPELAPRYNIAPTQQIGMVRTDPQGEREWSPARWGLVPFWAKEISIGARMINARAEGVASKPAFRAAVKARRCLIPADGFIEWRRVKKDRQPFLFRLDDHGPFAFAGLWERWQQPDGSPLDSCTIITTVANELVSSLHDRMPVILSPQEYATWLAPSPLAADELERLLVPLPAARMLATPVNPRVNNARFDDPACLEPFEEQARLF